MVEILQQLRSQLGRPAVVSPLVLLSQPHLLLVLNLAMYTSLITFATLAIAASLGTVDGTPSTLVIARAAEF